MRKSITKNGYVYLYRPEHPSSDNRGYALEHILIAEKKLGRPLRVGEEVHHLDLNRANNRKSNLLVLTHMQHVALHAWLSKGAPIADSKVSLNREVRRYVKGDEVYSNRTLCSQCGNSNYSNAEHCSIVCGNKSRRKVDVSKARMKYLIDTLSWVSIGKELGVSDNGARKIAKRLGLL